MMQLQCALRVGIGALTLLSAASGAAAESTAPLEQTVRAVSVDSGAVRNTAGARKTIYAVVVRAPDASWMRLRFDVADLGDSVEGGLPTVLRLTSLADGAVQHLTAESLAQWRNTSAYFNGDAVGLQLIASPDAAPSRVTVSTVLAGAPEAPGGIASICGPTDDRVLSDDDRAGRVLPAGCTAWLFSDAGSCMLTAGHCVVGGTDVIEFNVPLSSGSGAIQHPGPADQYAVDLNSIQFAYGFQGNDWAYFGCFPNTETGLDALEAQGAFHVLAATPPPVSGQSITITGYGLDDSPLEWSQVQQTHTGPYVEFAEPQFIVRYAVDTRPGNSGSAVVDDETGEAIGIHTSDGCTESGGSNAGTGVNNPGFQFALTTPLGVCVPETPLAFGFPDGLPFEFNPTGEVVRVEVTGQNGGTPQPDTGFLHYDIGAGFVTVPMQTVSPNVYDAVFPPIDCGTSVDYYFSAETTEAEVVTEPLFAPQFSFDGLAAGESSTVTFADDFETDQGWTVVNSQGLTKGQWERAIPNTGGRRGEPPSDADGSGNCYVTQNLGGNHDVDNGSTTLISPIMDASVGTPFISYWRWYSNSTGEWPFTDVFVVEVSADGGQSWVALETVGPDGLQVNGQWYHVEFEIADFVALTNQFRVRFIVEDADPDSVVEAGVDGVTLTNLGCVSSLPADLDGDGFVNVTDFLMLLGAWGPCAAPCPPYCLGDIDHDCTVGVNDFLALLAAWTS
jgi:hypothetical protein